MAQAPSRQGVKAVAVEFPIAWCGWIAGMESWGALCAAGFGCTMRLKRRSHQGHADTAQDGAGSRFLALRAFNPAPSGAMQNQMCTKLRSGSGLTLQLPPRFSLRQMSRFI